MEPLVFLVDDDPDVLRAVTRVLTSHRFRVRGFLSPTEALRALAEERPDVIVSDDRMPEMHGLEFLGAARSMLPHAGRLLVPSLHEPEAVLRATEEGLILRSVPKPWRPAELLSAIAEAADTSRR